MNISVEIEAQSLHTQFSGAAIAADGAEVPFEGIATVELEGVHCNFTNVGDVADLDGWDIPYTVSVRISSDDGTVDGEADDAFTALASELIEDDIMRHGFTVEDRVDEACIDMLAKCDLDFDHVAYDIRALLDELASQTTN